jgi:hypothetical protein
MKCVKNGGKRIIKFKQTCLFVYLFYSFITILNKYPTIFHTNVIGLMYQLIRWDKINDTF